MKFVFYRLLVLMMFMFIHCSDVQSGSGLKNYHFKHNKPQQITLPESLLEISGITYKDTKSVYAHNDEMGVVYEIDLNSGEILKKWQLGTIGVQGDFEDIAYAKGKFYLLESNGAIYEFEEAENNKSAEITLYKNNFSSNYEFEGLCFNRDKNELLLMCKDYSGRKYKDSRPVFSFSLKTLTVDPEPVFVIDLDELKDKFDTKKIFPSAIAKSPNDGNYFIISSKGAKIILEVTGKGKIIDVEKLSGKIHEQPEGLTIFPDGTLLISDEGVKSNATLTIYKMDKQD